MMASVATNLLDAELVIEMTIRPQADNYFESLDMSHAPSIVSAVANPYLRASQSDHHIWSVATDPIKLQVFQAC